jgi:hypothetical protein
MTIDRIVVSAFTQLHGGTASCELAAHITDDSSSSCLRILRAIFAPLLRNGNLSKKNVTAVPSIEPRPHTGFLAESTEYTSATHNINHSATSSSSSHHRSFITEVEDAEPLDWRTAESYPTLAAYKMCEKFDHAATRPTARILARHRHQHAERVEPCTIRSLPLPVMRCCELRARPLRLNAAIRRNARLHMHRSPNASANRHTTHDQRQRVSE